MATDEIIHEIPVFFSNQPDEDLFVLQYPLRSTDRPYRSDPPINSDVSRIRYKRQHQRLEIEYEQDTQCNFNRSSHNRLYQNQTINSIHEEKKEIFPFRLTSSIVAPKTNMAIGILNDGELHLTHLTGFMQMRPSCHVLDEADTKRKEAATAQQRQIQRSGTTDIPTSTATTTTGLKKRKGSVDFEIEEKVNDISIRNKNKKQQQQQEEQQQPLSVQIRRQETTRSQARRKKSFAYINSIEEEEKWIDLNWTPFESQHARMTFQSLYSPPVPLNNSNMISEWNIKSNKYFENIFKKQIDLDMEEMKDENDTVIKTTLPPGRDDLLKLSTHEQVIHLLRNVHVTTLKQITSFLDISLPTDKIKQIEVLTILEANGYCIQGCWVAQSRLLLLSPHESIARDILLCMFAKHRYVNRSTFVNVSNLPTGSMESVHLVTKLLQEFAIHIPPLTGQDTQQYQIWEFRLQTDISFINEYEQVIHRQNILLSRLADKLNITHIFQSNSSSSSSKALSPTTTIRNSNSFPTSSSSSSSSSSSTTNTIISPEIAKQYLITLINTLFGKYGICSINFIKKKISELIKEQKLMPLKNSIFMKILEEQGCLIDDINMLYCRKILNETYLDDIRKYFIILFTEKKQWRKVDLISRIEIMSNGDSKGTTDTVYNKLLRELAISQKGTGQWILKNGNYDE